MLLNVPFVPTDEAVIEAMLNLSEVGSTDLLYDLDSGDRRTLVAHDGAKPYSTKHQNYPLRQNQPSQIEREQNQSAD